MGKIYLRPVVREVLISEITAERFEELDYAEELDSQFDIQISDALSDIDYELYYKEEK